MGSAALFTQLMDPNKCNHGRQIIADISLQLRRQYGTPGLVVMQEGHFGDSMYFIKQGEVEIYKSFAASGRLCARGEQERTEPFGEEEHHGGLEQHGERLGRLGPRGFLANWVDVCASRRSDTGSVKSLRKRTAIAKTNCELLVLEKNDLDRLREQYNHLEESMDNIEKGLSEHEDAGDPRRDAAVDVAPQAADIHAVSTLAPKLDPNVIDELIGAAATIMKTEIDARMAKLRDDMLMQHR